MQRWNATGEIVELFAENANRRDWGKYTLMVLAKSRENDTVLFSKKFYNISPLTGDQIFTIQPSTNNNTMLGKPIVLLLTDMTDYQGQADVAPLKIVVGYDAKSKQARVDWTDSVSVPLYIPIKRTVNMDIPSLSEITLSFDMS